VAILERTVQFEQDREGFVAEWEIHERQLSRDIAQSRRLLPAMRYDGRDLYTIAELTSRFEVDGHRADIVILKTALAHAAYRLAASGVTSANSHRITPADIQAAAELALPHRLKRQPFEDSELRTEDISTRLEEIQSQQSETPLGSVGETPAPDDAKKNKT
jgi:Mg-chelatase subunit ChlI